MCVCACMGLSVCVCVSLYVSVCMSECLSISMCVCLSGCSVSVYVWVVPYGCACMRVGVRGVVTCCWWLALVIRYFISQGSLNSWFFYSQKLNSFFGFDSLTTCVSVCLCVCVCVGVCVCVSVCVSVCLHVCVWMTVGDYLGMMCLCVAISLMVHHVSMKDGLLIFYPSDRKKKINARSPTFLSYFFVRSILSGLGKRWEISVTLFNDTIKCTRVEL